MVEWLQEPLLEVLVHPGEWSLAGSLKEEVEAHWDMMTSRYPFYFRGPVLSVVAVRRGNPVLVEARFTDYAHYLYSRVHLPINHPERVRVIHASAAMVTLDNYLLVAHMAETTARPGWIQAVGGSPILDDVEYGRFNAIRSAVVEAREETGIDATDSSLVDKISVVGATLDSNGSMSVVVRMELNQSAKEATSSVREYLFGLRARGGRPELQDVLAIPLGEAGLYKLAQLPNRRVRYLETYVVRPELRR